MTQLTGRIVAIIASIVTGLALSLSFSVNAWGQEEPIVNSSLCPATQSPSCIDYINGLYQEILGPTTFYMNQDQFRRLVEECQNNSSTEMRDQIRAFLYQTSEFIAKNNPNPASCAAFANNIYLTFLHREPTGAEFSRATGQCAAGPQGMGQIAQVLISSGNPEYRQVHSFDGEAVENLYLNLLHRQFGHVSLDERNYWANLSAMGQSSLAQIEAAFYQSDEYASAHNFDADSCRSNVTQLYVDLLGRKPNDDELNSGQSRCEHGAEAFGQLAQEMVPNAPSDGGPRLRALICRYEAVPSPSNVIAPQAISGTDTKMSAISPATENKGAKPEIVVSDEAPDASYTAIISVDGKAGLDCIENEVANQPDGPSNCKTHRVSTVK